MVYKFALTIEFLLLCVVLPSVIIGFKLAPFMFTFLWGAAAYCFLVYRLQFATSLRKLWNWGAIKWSVLKPILLRWAIASLLMIPFIWWYDADRLFYLPRERPEVLLMLVFFYPVFSALPQEFIFCSFFFERYQRFFKGTVMIVASALVFAYAHVLYINPVAPVISFLGGLIFATTYARTRSLALVTLEHSLYGISLFFSGLGWYFYSGAVVQ